MIICNAILCPLFNLITFRDIPTKLHIFVKHIHHGLHCLLRQNQSSEIEKQYSLEIITYDPSKYTMDHPDLTVSNFMEKSNGVQRVSIVFFRFQQQ